MSPGRIRRATIAARAAIARRSGHRAGFALCALAAAVVPGVAGCGPPTSGKSASELYTEHCARCHGDDGRGDPRMVALSPNTDLQRSPLLRRKARGPLYLRISQASGSMPAFSHKLELGDIELLVDYVLELPMPEQQSQPAR